MPRARPPSMLLRPPSRGCQPASGTAVDTRYRTGRATSGTPARANGCRNSDPQGEADSRFCRVRRRPRVAGRPTPAPCGGRRRAGSFLFPARPRLGRRDRKILAEIQDLRRCVTASPRGLGGRRDPGRGGMGEPSARARPRPDRRTARRGSRTLAKPTPPARAPMRRSAPAARPIRRRNDTAARGRGRGDGRCVTRASARERPRAPAGCRRNPPEKKGPVRPVPFQPLAMRELRDRRVPSTENAGGSGRTSVAAGAGRGASRGARQ